MLCNRVDVRKLAVRPAKGEARQVQKTVQAGSSFACQRAEGENGCALRRVSGQEQAAKDGREDTNALFN